MRANYQKIFEMEQELGLTDLTLVDIQSMLGCRADNHWGPETWRKLSEYPEVLLKPKPRSCVCTGHVLEAEAMARRGSYPVKGMDYASLKRI